MQTDIKEDIRSYNVGQSDYSKHKIQPWDIWEEYQLNPWDADIIKRVLRTKEGEDRITDYEKIIHICKKRIEQLSKNKVRAKVEKENSLPTTFDDIRKNILENVHMLKFKKNGDKEEYIDTNCTLSKHYHIHRALCVNTLGKRPWGLSFGKFESPMSISWYDTLEEAADAANEDYKRRVKRILSGLNYINEKD